MSISRRQILLGAAFLQPGSSVVAIVLGPPGSGKTTQAKFLKGKYGIPIFSAETLLKKSHDRKSSFSKKIKGKLSPDELLTDQGMNELVREAVTKADHSKGFVLDGYPMTRPQADYLSGVLKELSLPEPLVIHLQVPDAVVMQRMAQRARADDKPEIIERRLKFYKEEEAAVLGYYPESRVLRVDGTKSAGDISKQIDSALTGKGH